MNALDQLVAEQTGNVPQGPTNTVSSLGALAAGGYNHAQQWMNPQEANPQSQQQPFARIAQTYGLNANSAQEDDSPPGAPPYASGPLAINPRPTPVPSPRNLTTAQEDIARKFSWSNSFNTNGP